MTRGGSIVIPDKARNEDVIPDKAQHAPKIGDLLRHGFPLSACGLGRNDKG